MVVLTGYAHAQSVEDQDVNDPFEPLNRVFFKVNLAADKLVFLPAAEGYHVLPQEARDGIRNFLNNLDSPVTFANDLLQGEGDRAGNTLVRFGINTTIGLAGILDVAQDWGYERHSEDFGQTLGTYGVGEGPYIYLPVIGPAPPRDLSGRAVDFAFDPLTYTKFEDKYFWSLARFSVDALDLRERNIDTLDEIERSSVDYYASIRSLYRQTRQNEITNGKSEMQDLPDF
jgi:phospholipid-binding lipoprotein MlaA